MKNENKSVIDWYISNAQNADPENDERIGYNWDDLSRGKKGSNENTTPKRDKKL